MIRLKLAVRWSIYILGTYIIGLGVGGLENRNALGREPEGIITPGRYLSP